MSPTNQRRRRRGGGKNNGPPPYNRPPIHDGRYGPSPGPPTAYPGHDIYNPGIGGAPYAADYSNDYGSQSELWRSEASFYPRPPSPDPYGYQPGPSTGGWAPQSWDHPTPPQWPDRAEPSPRFDGDPWTYDRPDAMTMAQPMFEPNDSWKQHHIGPPNTSRNDVAPEPYSPTRRLPPRFARDHYSPPRPLASDHYTVPTPGPPPFDQYPSGPGLVGQPPPTDHYFPGPSLNAPPPPGDHYPPGTNGLPYPGDHYSPGPSMSAPPFSGDHYSPPGLSGPPPFSGDHYSPGRSLNAPGYSGDRYRPETPPIYPYMNPGTDSYRPRYDDIPEPRAAHPPNPRVHPRWRLPSPERAPSIRGRASPESPNATKRVWEPRRTPPRELNSVDRLSPTRWSPSDPRREPRRIPSRGRSLTRSPSPSRGRSPLYSPRASRSPVRRQTRSPSRNRSPLYSPRASRSPIRGRTRSPIALRSPVGRKRRLRSPTLSYSPRRSRSRSPLPPRIARRYSRRSYTRSPSSSYDSYRASRARRSRGRRRSESRESVVDSRSKARSRSR
ncbi:uncharacterized protein B0H18DRAFT_1208225, partial [Fomitopsis serialis]|uniref:uncharacterized protein n=1 Tax=Fomitopsis serialis TaxID=139415 RepID=UPI002007A789